MDAQLKRKWIEALRGGGYKQARGALIHDGAYCCLGVLCAIQKVDFAIFPELETTELCGTDEYEEDFDYSAGLSSEQTVVLANMNDGHGCEPRSFDHIAGYIQAAIAEDQP